MPFPKTEDEFREQGYVYDGSGLCRGCSVKIDWWYTPDNKRMPVDPDTMKPHWSTCPNAKDFKRKK